MTNEEALIVALVFVAWAGIVIAGYAWYTSSVGPVEARAKAPATRRREYPVTCPSCGDDLPGRVLRCPTCAYDIFKRSWKATLAPWLVPLVGIVLAHMARSDFRLNPYWRGRTAATIALVLGYTLLAAPVVIALGVLFARWMAGDFS